LRRILVLAVATLAVLGLVTGWVLTMPRTLSPGDLPAHTPDLANGATMFWAGGCESCHAAPGAKGDAVFLLAGGEGLVSPFGTFYAPNISPEREDGIGNWSVLDFVNAMKFGVGARGEHLYPALPYASYQRMRLTDLIDLKAFLDTLPPVQGRAPPHQVSFPFSIRRGIGLWKLLYHDGRTFVPDPDRDAVHNRGAYLVEGPGHCGECHTPRTFIGGLDASRYLAGAPLPGSKDAAANITSHKDAIGWWSQDDLVVLFTSGQTPDFSGISGAMQAVQRNLAQLSPQDLQAMAAYLKTVPEIAPAMKQ